MIRKRRSFDEALLSFSQVLVSTLDVDRLVKLLLNRSISILNADGGSLMIFDKERLLIKASKELDEEVVRQVALRMGERIAGWVAKEKKPLLLIDGLKDDPRFVHLDERGEIASALSIPLLTEKKVIGVLNLNRITNQTNFTKEDLNLAIILSNIASSAIDNAIIHREVERKREEEMTRYKRLYNHNERLIKNIKDLLIVMDKDGRMEMVNQPVEDLLGYKSGELKGKKIDRVIENGNSFLRRLLAKKELENYGTTFYTEDGKELLLNLSASVIMVDKKIDSIILLARDTRVIDHLLFDLKRTNAELIEQSEKLEEMVKERTEELRESKDYIENIIESMIDTLLVVDPDARIKTINKATSDLLGYKEDELIGKPVATIFAEEEEEEEEEPFKGTRMKKLIKEGSIRNYDMAYRTKKGKKIPMSFSASVMHDEKGKFSGIVCVAKDLSEIKKMVEELKTLDKMKSEFLDLAAHELRTPLVSIKTNVEMLIDGDIGRISKEQKKMLVVINENIDKLSIMSKDIVMLVGIEVKSFGLKIEPVSIGDVVKEIISYEEFKEKEHNLIIDLPEKFPLVDADKNLITQAIKNLITNAFQYTPMRGTITISGAEEGDNIHLKVSDTGIGIPKREQEKIFEKFYQVKKGTDREYGSLGIGLTITKRIVERHRGKIWVESAVGEGSTFHVLLPKSLKTKKAC